MKWIGRPTSLKLSPREWLLLRVVPQDTGCWHWLGAHDRDGYASGNPTKIHRRLYEIMRGPIPDGLVIDHLCRNRGCVNPMHLEPVTVQENARRGLKGALQTHCFHGHLLAGTNLRIDHKGHRDCRTCNRINSARYRERLRAKELR